ncbi:MAG: hypothetical protein HC774_06045 [Sphingomonadales bacterium]|nr:hypothetical protein [Sphingomonadales bacterium]
MGHVQGRPRRRGGRYTHLRCRPRECAHSGLRSCGHADRKPRLARWQPHLQPQTAERRAAACGRRARWADRKGAIIRIYAADGTIAASYDVGLPRDGASLGHDLAIGPDGHIYVADVPAGRVLRFQLPSQSDQ